MSEARLRDVLRVARETGAVVTVFYSYSSQTAWVEALSERHVVLRTISSHGRADGFTLIKIEDVSRVDTAGRYEENLLFLFQMREQSHGAGFLPSPDEDADLALEILLAAQRQNLVVNVDGISGFVQSVEMECLTLTSLTSDGEANGETTLELEPIERIIVDDEDGQDLKLLARWRGSEMPGW